MEDSNGKSLTLCYDKRKIPYDRVKTVDTLPFGHNELGVYAMRTDMIDLINDSDSESDF